MNFYIYGSSYKLLDKELKKIIGDNPYQIYDLEEVSLEDVLTDINYTSMFDDKKYVVLKNISSILSIKKDDKNMQMLIDYLKSPNPLTTLLMLSKDKLASRGLQKDIASLVKVIETPVITKPYELAKLLGEVIRQNGYMINQNALNLFAEKCALNYDIALNEFDKLKGIKTDNKIISETDIINYVSNYNTNDVFAFKDKIINKDLASASKMIDELETSKMELIPIVVMLAKEYITLYNVKLLKDARRSNDEISKTLNNMHPYRVGLLVNASLKYSANDLEKIILYLCDLDRKLISEDNLGYDELRNFLLQL